MAGNWEIGKLKPVCDMNSTNVKKKTAIQPSIIQSVTTKYLNY